MVEREEFPRRVRYRLAADQRLASEALREVAIGTEWIDLGLGEDHTCAIQDGAVWCWGQNGSAQLGVLGASLSPVAYPGRVCLP